MTTQAIEQLVSTGLFSQEEAEAIVAKVTQGATADSLFPEAPADKQPMQDFSPDTVEIEQPFGSLRVGHTQQEAKEYMEALRKHTEAKVAKQQAEDAKVIAQVSAGSLSPSDWFKQQRERSASIKGTTANAMAQMDAIRAKLLGQA